MKQAGWQPPAELHYVPVDLETEGLAAALERSPFDRRVPGFFAWLGVTYFLQEAAVYETLQAIAAVAAPGSVVAFDFLDQDAFDPERTAPRVRQMQTLVQQAGEPMQCGFAPAKVALELGRHGLPLLEHLGPEEIHARYFSGRTDGFRAFEQIHFATARVHEQSMIG